MREMNQFQIILSFNLNYFSQLAQIHYISMNQEFQVTLKQFTDKILQKMRQQYNFSFDQLSISHLKRFRMGLAYYYPDLKQIAQLIKEQIKKKQTAPSNYQNFDLSQVIIKQIKKKQSTNLNKQTKLKDLISEQVKKKQSVTSNKQCIKPTTTEKLPENNKNKVQKIGRVKLIQHLCSFFQLSKDKKLSDKNEQQTEQNRSNISQELSSQEQELFLQKYSNEHIQSNKNVSSKNNFKIKKDN